MTKASHNDNDTDKFLLHDAIGECDNILHKELDLVLLPPENVDGDTDKEVGSGTELTDINLDQIQEVSRIVEFSTTRKATRGRKKKAKDQKLPKNYKEKVKNKIKK